MIEWFQLCSRTHIWKTEMVQTQKIRSEMFEELMQYVEVQPAETAGAGNLT